MIAHFIRRDYRDHRLYWLVIGVGTLLAAPFLLWSYETRQPAVGALGYFYFLANIGPMQSLVGSNWRTQHTMSRYYMLALPISHRSMFRMIQLRALVFFIPLVVLALLLPLLFLPEASPRWIVAGPLYYAGVAGSIIVMLNAHCGGILFAEQISSQIPKNQRLLAGVRMIAAAGLVGVLVVLFWGCLLAYAIDRPYRAALFDGHFFLVLLSLLTLLVTAGLFGRHTRRRWCVTMSPGG